MTQQIINVGTGPDSYTGESLRTAFQKVNENFSQLYVGNVGANISGNIVTANGFVTSGAVTTGTVAAAGNISAYYFTGNGSQLTGITGTANTGDLEFSGQTISGTIDGNIVIDPFGSGNVNIPSNLRAAGLRVGTLTNPELAVLVTDNTAVITTSGRGNGNVSLTISANTPRGVINIRADDGHMGFGVPADGYDYIFNGEIKANAYYADANFPVGYQFTTPGGDTGMSHDYQNDIHGNASVVIIKHDSFAAAKFYDNNHTVLSGNLIVSQDGNVFGSSFSDALIQTYADVNSYAQSIFQNLNSGNLASSDFILTADNGDDSSYYGDFGIASSTYNYPGFGVIKPNDVYILAVGANITGPGSTDGANLILGSTTGNIKMFVGIPEDANVVAEINTTSFLPGANVTYSLGSADRQWKDLWLSNSTMYLGGFPVTVSNIGALSVNGSPVASSYGNANVASYLPTYTGNIAGNIVKNGYAWTFGTDGGLTLSSSGEIVSAGNYALNDVPMYDVSNPGGGNLNIEILKVDAPTLGTDVQVGYTVALSNDPTNTFTLVSPIEDNGSYWSVVVSASWFNTLPSASYFNFAGDLNSTWKFNANGNLALPAGGVLLVSGGIVAGPIIASPAPTISGFSSISAQTLTASGNISGNVNGYTIGYRDIPQVSFTSNATLSLADAGKHYFSSNSANVITVPNNTTVSFSIGTAISIIQQGTANLTVTPGSGVTMYLAGNSTSSARTLGNYGMATLMKVATDTWFINGTGVS